MHESNKARDERSRHQTAPAEIIKKLVAVSEDPLATRAQIREAVAELQKVQWIQKAVRIDPFREEVLEVLALCEATKHGYATLNGDPLTTHLICTTMNIQPTRSAVSRIGKLMHELGYKRIQRAKVMHPTYLVPGTIRL